MASVSIFVAFAAGLVSFIAPCVLPLIPGLLSYLAGTTVADASNKRAIIFLNTIFFVLGFSLVFAALGVLLNTALASVAYSVQVWLSRIGGAIVIFFGLYLTGLLHISFLEQQHKFRVHAGKSKLLTSFLFGAAFGAGWTPCVGAALGVILGLAAAQPGSAFVLLLAYSFGLGVPFLIVGLFAGEAGRFLKRFARAANVINVIFGILMIILGILIFTQRLSSIIL